VLKNPFVAFSARCSEAKNPIFWVFWTCFGAVWVCFRITDRSDNDFFNSLAVSRKVTISVRMDKVSGGASLATENEIRG